MTGYVDFLADKAQLAASGGFEPTVMPDHLFGFQAQLVDWAVRQGRGAIFADCGLGKTPMELAWAQNVYEQTGNRYSHWIWRRYASSIWDDIRIDRVLPFRDAKDEDDEKHVHPLQLDVIARYLQLRTLPGERVLTPFMGVGSEVFETVRQGRYGIGAELKPSYYVQAERNMAAVDREDTDPEELDFADLEDELA